MEYCKGYNHIFIEALKIEISNFLSKKIQIFQPGTNNPTVDERLILPFITDRCVKFFLEKAVGEVASQRLLRKRESCEFGLRY